MCNMTYLYSNLFSLRGGKLSIHMDYGGNFPLIILIFFVMAYLSDRLLQLVDAWAAVN